jgi:hypothetical protein
MGRSTKPGQVTDALKTRVLKRLRDIAHKLWAADDPGQKNRQQPLADRQRKPARRNRPAAAWASWGNGGKRPNCQL